MKKSLSIREIVQAEMTRQGVTPYRMCKDLGVVDRAEISRWFGGTASIGVNKVEAIFDYLGLTVAKR